MKILQVIPYFYPAWTYGGPVRIAYELSKRLVERGHDVTVYTTDALDKSARLRSGGKTLDIDGIKVCYFKNLSNNLAFNHHLFISPSMILPMRGECQNFDILHLHDFRGFQSLVAYHYAKKHGLPYVLQAHGEIPRIAQKQMLKKMFDLFIGYKILRDASKVIAVTKTEAKQYGSMSVSEDKIEVVPNGIDLSEFANLPKRGEFRSKNNLNDSQKIILYLGRLNKVKGLDLLARAFAGLSRDLDNARLVVVGPDDGYLSTLEKIIEELKIKDKVLFTGPLYGKDRLGAYVDADVFVNPRADEIFGLVFLEASACGTPVMCSQGCGIADVIDGQIGLVVPYDKEQLQHALLHILGDIKMRREFGEKGKLLVRERFNWEKIAEQVENLYERVLK